MRDCLAEPLTLDGLIMSVNQRLDPPWPEEIARDLVYSIHGHAERLVALGAANTELGADGRVVYQRSASA